MKWRLERIDWHSHGNCWSWPRARKYVYYRGNQVQITWGRIALVFERREWSYDRALTEREKRLIDRSYDHYMAGSNPRWRCRRCGEMVNMVKKRCGCTQGPGPWEPVSDMDDNGEVSDAGPEPASLQQQRERSGVREH